MAKRTEFEVGTMVILLTDYPDDNRCLTAGMTGTVMVANKRAGVRWDNFDNGNALSGTLTGDECHSGWYVNDDDIEIYCEREISEEDIADSAELFAFIGI